jgi:hypothetical protein
MAFASGDKLRIIKVLNLHKDQIKADSVLSSLMADLEVYDTANSTTYVTEVQTALTDAETSSANIKANRGQDGYTQISIPNEVSIMQGVGSSGAVTAQYQYAKSEAISRIKQFLDEDDLLDAFVVSGRVISSI